MSFALLRNGEIKYFFNKVKYLTCTVVKTKLKAYYHLGYIKTI